MTSARALLQIVPTPEALLDLNQEELAWALLEDMQFKLANPINGMARKDSLSAGMFPPSAVNKDPIKMRELISALDRAGRKSYALLEEREFIEPAPNQNGRNGYLVLTNQGKSAQKGTHYERVRLRTLLKEETLHPKLHGRIFGYFYSDDLSTAVFEAFKLVEIEVRIAGNFPEKENGKPLMHRAFAERGPLVKPSDDERDREGLYCLFYGAIQRFRHPAAHNNLNYDDVLAAMEELSLASKLLRIIDERRPR